jgi:hypothetical protein
LGGGRTVGVQSGRMDRDSSAPSSPRFAGCLPVVPLPLMAGSNTPQSEGESALVRV